MELTTIASLIAFSIACLLDCWTTDKVIKAGGVELNHLYGQHPTLTKLLLVHGAAVAVTGLFAYIIPEVSYVAWGGAVLLTGVSVHNFRVWQNIK